MKNKKSFREMLLSGILDAIRQLRRSRHQRSGVLRSDQGAEEELKPAGDAHAGGPYASFYPEDDLGGCPSDYIASDVLEDLPEPASSCRLAGDPLPRLLAWKFLSDE